MFTTQQNVGWDIREAQRTETVQWWGWAWPMGGSEEAWWEGGYMKIPWRMDKIRIWGEEEASSGWRGCPGERRELEVPAGYALKAKMAYLPGVAKLLLNQTYVCLPVPSKGNLLTWVVVKQSAKFIAGHQARSPGSWFSKAPNSLTVFRERLLKTRVREEDCWVPD